MFRSDESTGLQTVASEPAAAADADALAAARGSTGSHAGSIGWSPKAGSPEGKCPRPAVTTPASSHVSSAPRCGVRAPAAPSTTPCGQRPPSRWPFEPQSVVRPGRGLRHLPNGSRACIKRTTQLSAGRGCIGSSQWLLPRFHPPSAFLTSPLSHSPAPPVCSGLLVVGAQVAPAVPASSSSTSQQLPLEDQQSHASSCADHA